MVICSKKSFESKDEAVKRLNEILVTSDRVIKPLRVYKCENCGKFHLTSFTKKKQSKVLYNQSKEGQQEIRIKKSATDWSIKNGWI